MHFVHRQYCINFTQFSERYVTSFITNLFCLVMVFRVSLWTEFLLLFRWTKNFESQPLTVDTQVQYWASPWEICSGQRQQRSFLSDYFGFPLAIWFHQCSIHIFIYIYITLTGRTNGQCLRAFQRGTILQTTESI